MGNRIIHLVRHGQYVTDEDDPEHGHLTRLGQRQALRTGKRLADLPIETIFHSDLPRATETAQLIGECSAKVPLRATRLLREVCPPVPKAMRVGKNSLKELPWAAGHTQVKRAAERFLVAVHGKEPRHVVLVTHGNFIRYFIRRLMKDPLDQWIYWGTGQCGISTVVIRDKPAKPCLVCYNDVGHLPRRMQTGI